MSRRLLAINPVDHPGGAETGLLRLLAELARRGWSITATTPATGPLQRAIAAAGHEWSALPLGGIGRRQGLPALASLPAARRLAARADTVLLNGAVTGRLLPGLAPPAAPARVRQALRTPARLVLHVHDMVTRIPAIWGLADAVLTDSEAAAAPMSSLRPDVVFCPVDLDPPSVAARWPADRPVAGYVGRIEPRKGLLDLTEAARILHAGRPEIRMVLIGEPAPHAPDPAYAQTVLGSPDLEHIGWRDDAPSLMRHLDVLVLPSHREPFGTVLAEAMAVGTPVVATRVDGLPEVVDDGVTGRLVPPHDPPALAHAILDVLEHRNAMSAAARDHARRFSTAAYADRVEPLLA